MRTLIIHHLESMWEDSYKKMGGISFEGLVEKFAEHFESEAYDRVILTRFEDNRLEDGHWPIAEFVDEIHDYAYGWTNEDRENSPEMFCEGGTHSEAVLIEDWMKIEGEVFISGAFSGECLDDIETAFNHLGIKYNMVNSLII